MVPKYNIVMANGAAIHVAPAQFKLIGFLLRVAKTRQMLVDLMYADDPDGGPISALWCVSEIIGRTNRKLRDVGLQISHVGGGTTAFLYKIENIKQAK